VIARQCNLRKVNRQWVERHQGDEQVAACFLENVAAQK